ncbi:condensin complex subunit 2/barren [Sporodiniella umbellata]|nr:condensin complex subunit 2/barren [Sporodiniella umbellata]
MYSNFEEWIKLCTDNKVNASNTWDFSLIDYFHEMTFIREGDSINFQKASCTLDGCVKIYTSRVDSVATETGKLLSGLADSSHDNEDEEVRKERMMRRKSQRSNTSLVKDFSAISLKKFDLDFAVDPLFKKTSADFDEGGARGLLLNHLGVDRHCKIIFDASDSTVDYFSSDEADDEQENQEKELDKQEKLRSEVPEEVQGEAMEIDTEGFEESQEIEGCQEETDKNALNTESGLEETNTNESDKEEISLESTILETEKQADNLEKEIAEDNANTNTDSQNTEVEENPAKVQIPDTSSWVEISRLKAKLQNLEQLEDLSIVPSLKAFDFFSENLLIPELHSEEEMEDNPKDTNEEEENMIPDYGNDYDMDYENDVSIDPFNLDDQELGDDGQLDDTEKGYPEKDYLVALLNNENKDLFNYFDNTLVKDWAGPEHWKLRRPPVTKETETTANTEEKGAKKKSKQTSLIDFKETEEDETAEAIFESASKKITLPNSSINSNKYLLPDDIHFSSKQFLRYFLKPMFPTDEKKKNNIHTTDDDIPSTTAEDEPDTNFWAEQTQDYGDYGADIDYNNSLPGDMFDNPESTILSAMDDSVIYQDTYDDFETPGVYGDTLITGHQLKRTRPLYVNYAKTSKRVDVKKLKDNLWKALVPGNEQVVGKFKFIDIISNLKKMYPPKEMKDISVPFCFICLLHLANEKDLVLTNDDKDDDFVLGDEDWISDESKLSNFTVYQNVK